jgi:hypothetical protein
MNHQGNPAVCLFLVAYILIISSCAAAVPMICEWFPTRWPRIVRGTLGTSASIVCIILFTILAIRLGGKL